MNCKAIIRSCSFFLFLLLPASLLAQTDTLHLHNGQNESAVITRVGMHSLGYRFKNEDADRNISVYALDRVSYRSGRKETYTKKIDLTGDSAWAKVVTLKNEAETEGLKRVETISAHTAFVNLHTSRSGADAARKKLFKKAAQLGCPFVLIIEDKEILYGMIKFWGVSQHRYRAIAYSY